MQFYTETSTTHAYSAFVSRDDWSSDQHKSFDQGRLLTSKKNPLVSKSCFHIHTPDGPSMEFTTHAYQLPSNSSSINLVHYIGKKKAAVEFPPSTEIKRTTRRMHHVCCGLVCVLGCASGLVWASPIHEKGRSRKSKE